MYSQKYLVYWEYYSCFLCINFEWKKVDSNINKQQQLIELKIQKIYEVPSILHWINRNSIRIRDRLSSKYLVVIIEEYSNLLNVSRILMNIQRIRQHLSSHSICSVQCPVHLIFRLTNFAIELNFTYSYFTSMIQPFIEELFEKIEPILKWIKECLSSWHFKTVYASHFAKFSICMLNIDVVLCIL